MDLTPTDGAAVWLSGHRRAAVRHILARGGVAATPDALRLCGDVPVMAVFLTWLWEQGRHADLADLLGEQDFRDWVLKRLQQTFPGKGIQADLALLMGLLPVRTAALGGEAPWGLSTRLSLPFSAWPMRLGSPLPAGLCC